MERKSAWIHRDYLGEEKSSFLSGTIKCFGSWYNNGYVDEIYDLMEDLKYSVGADNSNDNNIFWFTSEYDNAEYKERIIITVVNLLVDPDQHLILARIAALAVNRRDSVFVTHLFKAFSA